LVQKVTSFKIAFTMVDIDRKVAIYYKNVLSEIYTNKTAMLIRS